LKRLNLNSRVALSIHRPINLGPPRRIVHWSKRSQPQQQTQLKATR
jgi:hypothetical protein